LNPRHRGARGFSLVELAIVLFVVGLLMVSLMYTLTAQFDQRNFEETRRRVEQARELLLAYAIVNGRLPCPARSSVGPTELRDANGNCTDGATEDYYGGTIAAGVTGGLLPAATIGFQPTDNAGFAVDAWQNRIRYAVAKTNTNCATPPPANTRLWTHAGNLKLYGLACLPGDLLVCKSATGVTTTACGGAANQIMTQDLVVAIIYSTGKNGAAGGAGIDEKTNLKTNPALGAAPYPVFVFHPPTPADFANGEFDDQMNWITVGELYGKLIGAGVLP
jgi:prepilin-type N-terminal cleavage/methylation domain-containing protein